MTDGLVPSLRRELSDGILTITLARPHAMNSFTPQMADELVASFAYADEDDAVRAVVVTGEGRAFCAGMDLTADSNVFGLDETLVPTPKDLRTRFEDPIIKHGVRDTGGRVSLAIYACHKPVIGAINGAAVGVGATMTLPMDVRLASSEARVGFVFGKIGIVPEACSTWFLPRIVGLSNALELAYTGDILTADDALRLGLVRSVHQPEDLLPAANAIAERFVHERSGVAVALTRQMLYRNHALPHPSDAHRAESLAMWHTSIGDGKEGVAAFRQKRAPSFSARVHGYVPQVFEEES